MQSADRDTSEARPEVIRTTRKRFFSVEGVDERGCLRLIIRHLVCETEGAVIASSILTPAEAYSLGHALMAAALRYGIDPGRQAVERVPCE